MTGGGDLDEPVHEELAQTLDEAAGEGDESPIAAAAEADEIDELGGRGDGEADAPVAFDEALDENDPDPTAGASDIGGLPGGIDVDSDASEGSARR